MPGYGQPYGAPLPGTDPYGGNPYAAYPYGQYAYAPYPMRKTNGLAVASLVTSIAAVVLCAACTIFGIAAPVGAVLGHVARRQIRERGDDGDGMALAGIIVGWIGTGLFVLAIVLVGLVVLSGATTAP